MNIQQEVQEIIEQKITKVNGEIGYKKYLKGKLLGKGGFAKCYEGINIQTKKMYAIKVIQKNSLQKNRAKQKLLSQIKIHKTLHHPYIVQFDSVFQDTKNVYIILELCTCKTLSQMVKKRKKLTPKQARFYMLQLVSGLQYMHGNRVIHRDLKMGNIFLNANMDMKIGDFGLAAKLQFLEEKKRTMCGTPNYIAPQIVQGAVGHSYEVDLWSTGVICYALLYGRPPFQTNQVKTTYKKIKSCEYVFPSGGGIPDQAKDFIKKILVLDPKQRLTLKQMLAHPFLNSEGIPKFIPVQALNNIPTFKNGIQQTPDELCRMKSSQKLRPDDFGKKLGASNGFQGLQSPRNLFNQPGTDRLKQINTQTAQKTNDHNINVISYVDYSTKYGLGYLINNKNYGVYFNDSSVLSVDQKKSTLWYIENATAKEDKVEMFKIEDIPKQRNFQKKYQLLERFIVSLNDEVKKLDQNKINYQKDSQFVFMKQWLKTKHAIMFRLNNKLFQVNFFDNSQILLNTDKKTVLFTSKKGQKIYDTLSNSLQLKETQMARRIKYTKEILNSIKKGKQEKIQDIK